MNERDLPPGFGKPPAPKRPAKRYAKRLDVERSEDAQDDGRACIVCGAEGRPMVPTGARGSRGAQLFACEGHSVPPAAAIAERMLVALVEASTGAMALSSEGSIEWWRAETKRSPLAESDRCDVRGDVLAELLRAHEEREKAGKA